MSVFLIFPEKKKERKKERIASIRRSNNFGKIIFTIRGEGNA
jgi:hypothetical protein